ncbi:hypothetical protein AGOR_G00244810 [Albula goreensis]|uniref:Uncharacterized protein n=1 Tax=Albula goreensis TaxID=1534307 RepID=A0A8T3CFV4_9TELE|nr:hypothetical protein AGOR_G00244810 [Albula goreensis]
MAQVVGSSRSLGWRARTMQTVTGVFGGSPTQSASAEPHPMRASHPAHPHEHGAQPPHPPFCVPSVRQPGGERVRGERGRGRSGCVDRAVQRRALAAGRRGALQTPGHGRLPEHNRRAVRPPNQGTAGGPRHARSQSQQLLESHGGRVYQNQPGTPTA